MEALVYHSHSKRVQRELIEAGVTIYGLLKSESRYLPHVIHLDEHIHAVVYGQHHSNSVMLVATDKRVVYLDKKPMATFVDEVTYDVVSGIELDVHTFFATVTLHTAVVNYDIKFVNIHCAEKFTRFIEDQKVKKFFEQNDKTSQKQTNERSRLLETMMPNMAGYYWVPPAEKEEEIVKV